MDSQASQRTRETVELMQSVRTKFMVIRLIHLALLAGSMMFGGVVFFLSHKQLTAGPFNPVVIIAGVVCFTSIAGSLFIRKVMQGGGVVAADPNALLMKYQTICLIQWAMIEGGSLFCAVIALVTKHAFPFLCFAVCIAFLAFRRPSEKEMIAMFSGHRSMFPC